MARHANLTASDDFGFALWKARRIQVGRGGLESPSSVAIGPVALAPRKWEAERKGMCYRAALHWKATVRLNRYRRL
jgi:hypothetical protein